MPHIIPPQATPGVTSEGDVNVRIGNDGKGTVYIEFGTPLKWFGLSNDEAINLAKQILRAAGVKKVNLIL